jgi:hypothetical protein
MLLHGLKYFERVRLPWYVSFLVLYKLKSVRLFPVMPGCERGGPMYEKWGRRRESA